MKKIVSFVLILGMVLGASFVTHADIGESALLNLLGQISEVPDDQLLQYVGILESYLSNNTTIQNFSDDVGILYDSVLTENQRQKLEGRNISVSDMSEEILLLKDWEDSGDYTLLISAVSLRDKDSIEALLVEHGIVSGSSEESFGESSGAALSLEGNDSSLERFMTMEAIREALFTDIEGHWAAENVRRLYSIGLINGRSNEVFDPDADITRAEFLSMLVRILRIEEAAIEEDCPFGDVGENSWYRGGIMAAFGAGLASGNEDGSFAPERKITRQEMAVMADNALMYMNENGIANIDLSGAFTQTFVDIETIAPWAYGAMERLNGLGLMLGDKGALRPGGNTTRAEAATVLMRLIETAEL